MCTGMAGARGALLACNIVLMLIAATCIAGAAVLIIGRTVYGSELEFLRQNLGKAAEDIRGDTTLNVSNLDVIFITLPLGVALIILGALIATLCILGIIASCGRFYKFIIVYMSLLAFLLFAEIVVILCVYIDRKPFDSTIRKLLKSSLQAYTDINGEDSFSLGWNAVMSYRQCCGVDSYQDFVLAGYPKTVTSGAKTYTAETPQVCCIDKTTAGTCDINANFKTQTFYNYGCYDAIWDYVTSDTGLIIVCVFFVMAIQYLCLFFSLWLVCWRRSLGRHKISSYE